MILEGTRMNCGGGATPWGAWVSKFNIRETKSFDPKRKIWGAFVF
jgi:secreted PhoX family phosphatase